MTITLSDIRRKLSTALLSDALDSIGRRSQSPRVDLRPFTSIALLAGRARTTLWADMAYADPSPYELELAAVDSLRPDDVLVAAASGSLRSGVWGELLSTAALNGGCAGALVDGAIRDVAKMRKMGFPVFARGVSPCDSRDRQRVIAIDVPVEVGGVIIHPGDLVLADEDGAVIVPRDLEEEAVRRAWEKAHAEDAVREAIRGGMKAEAAFRKFGTL